MKVKQEIKLNNGKVEIVTKQEHEFSDLEKEILKKLALNGYYEIKVNGVEPLSDNIEFHACERLIELGLVKEDTNAWNYMIEVVKSEEVGSFFLQIIKEGFKMSESLNATNEWCRVTNALIAKYKRLSETKPEKCLEELATIKEWLVQNNFLTEEELRKAL